MRRDQTPYDDEPSSRELDAAADYFGLDDDETGAAEVRAYMEACEIEWLERTRAGF